MKSANSSDNASVVAELVAELDALRNQSQVQNGSSQDQAMLDDLMASRENEKRLSEELDTLKQEMEAKES